MYLRIPSSWLNMAKFLGLICLLLITAEITQAQSLPTLSINDIVVNETDSGLFGYDFTISLSAPSANLVSVHVATQNGSATGDVDFVAGGIDLDIQPGKTSQTVQVFIKGDTIVEGTEQFFVNLSNPVNATIAKSQGAATIIDDDTLLLLNQTSSSRGLAVDSVFHTKETFAINTGDLPFYSTDHRNRIAVFAIGLKLAQGEGASAVTATAEDSVGTIRPLTVEFVGTVPNNNLWLTQVVLKLNDQITTAGDQKIRISLHGQTSNAVLVAVTP
jgi:Calx-beta domain-containing protein